MPFRWRELREADLLDCLMLHQGHVGDEIVGRERALELWRTLIRNPGFHSAVIEDPESQRIVAFGASVFVTEQFAASELAEPRPYLNSRILESMHVDRPVILSLESIARANAQGSLNVAVLYSNWDLALKPIQVHEVQALFAISFYELHVGYNLSRLIFEAVDEGDLRYAESISAWRILCRFAQLPHALATCTLESSMVRTGSAAMLLFHRRAAVLRLRRPSQELLLLAVRGFSDIEIAQKLHLSLPAVRQRWASIFEQVGARRPDLLPPAQGPVRGEEKRKKLLNFVREHREELRPYWYERDDM